MLKHERAAAFGGKAVSSTQVKLFDQLSAEYAAKKHGGEKCGKRWQWRRLRPSNQELCHGTFASVTTLSEFVISVSYLQFW